MIDAAILTAIAACIGAVGGPLVGILALFQSRRNRQAIATVETKIDGPLQALIASIRAEAEVKIAFAEENRRQAFRRGQDHPRAADPALTAAIATEAVRVATGGSAP